jgi:hypothetical protein
MNRNRKNQDIFSALVASKKLTPEGRDWLVLALDPFHDQQHHAAGYPDMDGSNTLVSCHKYQTTIAAPAGVVGNWDCHVFNSPLCGLNNGMLTTTNAAQNTFAEPFGLPQSNSMSTLNIFSNAAGLSMNPTIPAVATWTSAQLPSAGGNEAIEGASRVIGIGYEVTNTTAEMYKQGSVTCYRMPQMLSTPASGALIDSGANTYAETYVKYRMPPSTAALANTLAGTKTWAAAEGVYVTCVQNSVTNPISQTCNTVFIGDNTNVAGAAATSWHGMANPVTMIPPAVGVNTGKSNKVMPFNTTGCFFTGLSTQTTLTIKLKIYVERAPTFLEPSLSVLASPSAPYDVLALELYARAVAELPVAVPVAENGLGDWFRTILKIVKGAAGPVGAALDPFFPGAARVGRSIQNIAGEVSGYDRRPDQERLQRQMRDAVAAKSRVTKDVLNSVKLKPFKVRN